MFEDYRDIVFAAYKKKRTEGSLSLNLLKPTPAKLKGECLHVYAGSRSSKDDNTLRLFFGPRKDESDFSKNIDRLDTDKFKPLVNFLIGKTSDTDEKNIELLAWLINFEDRPYVFGKNYNVQIASENVKEIEELSDKGEKVDGADNGLKNVEKVETFFNQEYVNGSSDGDEEKKKKSKIRSAIVSFALIAAIGSGAFLFLSKEQKCMYWAEDHYQSVSCNKKIDDVPIIAFDANKATYQKKITRPDTLTKKSLGKVWYIKVDGLPEFYTSGGEYPKDTRKRLLPVTSYILDKYVLR